MLSAEERRQRILANAEKRMAKLREINRDDMSSNMEPIATEAPPELWTAAGQELINKPANSAETCRDESSSSLISTVMSTVNMLNSFTSTSKSSTTQENTEEMIQVDKQHGIMLLLGVFIAILYSFYMSYESSLFFVIYFTACSWVLTSRYYIMKMKLRSNVFITTAMLSGFQPGLMKSLLFLYTLIHDGWILFSFYFVSFCLTHVVCSLF